MVSGSEESVVVVVEICILANCRVGICKLGGSGGGPLSFMNAFFSFLFVGYKRGGGRME